MQYEYEDIDRSNVVKECVHLERRHGSAFA
jgi:hypothetical protein